MRALHPGTRMRPAGWEDADRPAAEENPATDDLRERLAIPESRLDDLNALLLDPESRLVNGLLEVVRRYGTPEEINRRAREAAELPALLERVRVSHPQYVADLEWLAEQRDRGAFVSVADFRRDVVGDRASRMAFRSGVNRPSNSTTFRVTVSNTSRISALLIIR